MTTMPQPALPASSYTATYDAWNRLVKIVDGSDTVSEYEYDGAKRRVIQKSYVSGTLDETRHLYYTEPSKWQVVEERVDSSSDAHEQFVWGLRYVDDLVLRDRDTTGNGTLDERLYALQDANWNVTSLVNTSGTVQQRFNYDAYGMPEFLTSTFAASTNTKDFEILFAGYRFEEATNLFHIRHRVFNTKLGCWIQRDPIGFADGPNLYEYGGAGPLNSTDPSGEVVIIIAVGAGVVVTGTQVVIAAGAAVITYMLVFHHERILEGCRNVAQAIAQAITGVEAICEFYEEWCRWGNVCGYQPAWRPYGGRSPCEKCFLTCVRSAGIWPLELCPIGNADGGPPQANHHEGNLPDEGWRDGC